MSPKPPQPAPVWDHTPDQIIKLTEQVIKTSRQTLDSIASLNPGKANFQTVVLPLAENDAKISTAQVVTFYQYVSPDQDVRNAAVESKKNFSQYELEVNSRLDVYKILLAAKSNTNLVDLDSESIRLIDKLILERTRNGLDLPEEDQKQYNRLQNEINDLQIDFQKNLNEETGKVWFTIEELQGVPSDVLSGFEKNEQGDLAMSFKTPDFIPVIQYAINPETRKRAVLAYDSRAASNVPLLERILALRHQAARTLKKSDWASYALEIKMAKNTTTVKDFLDDLKDKLTPIAKLEREKLVELKRKEVMENGLKADTNKFQIWDYRYYERLYTEKALNLRSELVKEYFPVSIVVNVILETYQSLLGVKFFKIEDAKMWHSDATQWAVWDSDAINDGSVEQNGQGFLGYLHLDLEPRPSKYGHAAVWGLIPGYIKPDGSRNYPVVAMVANLAKQTADKPALMTHDNVVTFFHEMGHAFHGLCSQTRYARFHGTNVARDFVEAPSQMLENWCWNETQLLKMSQHYQRSEEKLPKDLVEKIIGSRDLLSGLFNLRQLFFGTFDLHVHTVSKTDPDLTKTWCSMRDEISLMDPADEYSPGQSAFAHIVGGYDAGYYGYLYSQVFSADMFVTIFEKDPTSAASGKLYREQILKPGGSRDEMDSLRHFLGRKPNNEAFMKRLLGRQGEKEI